MTVDQILAWADAWQRRTGNWPAVASGAVPEAPGERWSNIEALLHRGGRGLTGGTSLARLLTEHRGVRNAKYPPRLTLEEVRAWAQEHRERTGCWPTQQSGPIAAAAGEKWVLVDAALRNGHRGLPGGLSLHRLLHEPDGELDATPERVR